MRWPSLLAEESGAPAASAPEGAAARQRRGGGALGSHSGAAAATAAAAAARLRWSFLVSAAAPPGAAPQCRLLVVSARELVLLAPVSGCVTLRAPLAALESVACEGGAGDARPARLVLELQLDGSGAGGAGFGRALELAVAPLRAGDADALLLSLFQPAAVRLVRGKERAAFESGSDAASVLALLRAEVLAAAHILVEPSLAYVLDGVTMQAETACAASLSLGERELSLARGGIELLRYPLTHLTRVHLLERGLALLAFKDGRLLGLCIEDDAILFLLTLLGRAAAQDLDEQELLLDGALGWLDSEDPPARHWHWQQEREDSEEQAGRQRLQPSERQQPAQGLPPALTPAAPAPLTAASAQRPSYKERQARQRSASAEKVLEDARLLLAESAARASQGRAEAPRASPRPGPASAVLRGEDDDQDARPAKPSLQWQARKAAPRAHGEAEERARSPAGPGPAVGLEPRAELAAADQASAQGEAQSQAVAAQADAGVVSEAHDAEPASAPRRKRGNCKQQ
jgi:hypothetical protein